MKYYVLGFEKHGFIGRPIQMETRGLIQFVQIYEYSVVDSLSEATIFSEDNKDMQSCISSFNDESYTSKLGKFKMFEVMGY